MSPECGACSPRPPLTRSPSFTHPCRTSGGSVRLSERRIAVVPFLVAPWPLASGPWEARPASRTTCLTKAGRTVSACRREPRRRAEVRPGVAREPPVGPQCSPLQAPHSPQGARPVVRRPQAAGPRGKWWRFAGGAAGPEWCTQGPGAQGRPRGAVGHTPPLPSLSSAYVQLLRDTGAVRSQEPAHSRAAPGTCEGQPSD